MSIRNGPLYLKQRWIYGILSVLMMGFIFWFSAMPARESAEVSGQVTEIAVKIAYPDYPQMPRQRQRSVFAFVQHLVRKGAHVTEYIALGALLALFFSTFQGRLKLLLGWPAAVAYAACDEFHQAFVSGRGAMVTDVLIDAVGVTVGVAAILLFFYIRRRMGKA